MLNRFLVGLTKVQFHELGQQERGQGCKRNKCESNIFQIFFFMFSHLSGLRWRPDI